MIKTFDYLPLLEPMEDEIMAAIQRVLHSGRLILGPETEAFEQEFAAHVGARTLYWCLIRNCRITFGFARVGRWSW